MPDSFRSDSARLRGSRAFDMAVRFNLDFPAKLVRGFWRTYARPGAFPIKKDTMAFWDGYYQTASIDDAHTVDPSQPAYSALYHYRSVELLILRHLVNRRLSLTDARVLDIGTGAGHWIDFYRALGATHVHGIDVSKAAVDAVRRRYAGCDGVSVAVGDAARGFDGQDYDVINAIGVLFHIVDDAAWEAALANIVAALKPGGLLIVGGWFGWATVNVQFDAAGAVTKRLRSRRRWRRALTGCRSLTIRRNRANLSIHDILPENHILVAMK